MTARPIPSIHQFLSWLRRWHRSSRVTLKHMSYREVPLKIWIQEQAEKFGVSTTAIHMKILRGKMPRPPMRRVNKRVIFVRVENL